MLSAKIFTNLQVLQTEPQKCYWCSDVLSTNTGTYQKLILSAWSTDTLQNVTNVETRVSTH